MLLVENIQILLNVVAEVTDGEGPLVSTGVNRDGGHGVNPVDKYAGSANCRFTLNSTAFTGTGMAVDIVTVIDGVDVIVASFTDVTGIEQQFLLVENCPINVKAVYVENAVTDWDCTIHSVRF
jgi:hypothetical protein